MKIGYKGFDKNLKCRSEQFELDKVYEKPVKENLRLCSSDGWHYCNKLTDCFNHYSNNGENRFCEIEIIGSFKDDGDKSITTSFRIIKEISKEELFDMVAESRMNLPLVRELQKSYPQFHIGGSVALYLYGVRLKRWVKKGGKAGDLDIVSPYFVLVQDFEDNEVIQLDAKASGNDFDETFLINDVKVDVRIDPKQAYLIIEHKGYHYKVSKFEAIMAAKMKYAMNGQKKHIEDIREMCGVKINLPEKKAKQNTTSDLPW